MTAPARVFTPKYHKPVGARCEGCQLGTQGIGYVPRGGPADAPILFLGESPAVDEQIHGEPFKGAAGSMLTRLLRHIGVTREAYPVDNVVRCTPPHQLNVKAFPDAVRHCQYWAHEAAAGAAPPRVIVTLGALPTRHLLGLTAKKHTGIEEFHGTVHQVAAWPGTYIVPTFHPSYLQRGATNLMGVVQWDLQRAFQVARDGWHPRPSSLVIDPPVDWFAAWVDVVIAARAQDPAAYPLAVDIETPDKGGDEGAIVNAAEERSYQILRLNFSINDDEGVTVPADPAYLSHIQRVLATPGIRYYWFKGFDEPRLLAARGLLPAREDRQWNWDCMWMAKALQSDLPQSLGFWAPFYSDFGAWKHWYESAPGKYGAVDGLQTRRVGDGLVRDLVDAGMWDIFARHMHHFHQIVLQPATDLGVPIDRERLVAFRTTLDREAARLLDAIQAAVPDELKPETPKLGLTRPPPEGLLHTKGRATKKDGTEKKEAPDPIKMALYARATVVERIVLREVNVCVTCGKPEVAKTHRCQPGLVVEGAPAMADGKPVIEKKVASVTRWFWKEPFNPDSPDQMMAYVKAKRHKPGKSKSTGNDAVDRETLARLVRETKDPFYQQNLDYRAVGKVRGTYAVGTEKRLDAEDRLHGTFGFKPSTMRLNSAAPNLQNVVADKGEKKKGLAAGFRHCVVARGRMVEVGSGWEDSDASGVV